MGRRTAIIVGAGPAGLTAAYELLDKTDIKPVVYEKSGDIGGISKTVNYKGNRIDIGGHRFFSKSDTIMEWWQKILPMQGAPARDDIAVGRKVPLSEGGPDPEKTDSVMLVRSRLSRIFFLRRFFQYPISLHPNTFLNLGLTESLKIACSYVVARLSPIKKETSLEDFFINRFGRRLYMTFFKDYTEKVWGVPCSLIKPEWGAQRIKGLSVKKALVHAFKGMISSDSSISQKSTETSLIRQFMYPKFGPGQMWEEVARIVREKGGEIHLKCTVTEVKHWNKKVLEVVIRDESRGSERAERGDFFLSSMPVRDLIRAFGNYPPADVQQVSEGLRYRDFITVGLLLKNLKIRNDTAIRTVNNIVPDNWIYIQERDVKVGRLQIFNNWSPYMVSDKNNMWVGLEYFCSEGDQLWNATDEDLTKMAIKELSKIGIINKEDVLDSTVIRMDKTYPAYFGTYDRFHLIRDFVDKFENLYLIGRNGLHRYNNMDHSMLSALKAVENIINGVISKENIWSVNTEEEYHERK